MDLSGRVALITGGGGHIGGAFADALAELGAAICVLDVSEQGCLDTVHRLSSRGVPVSTLVVDLADPAAVLDVPNRIRQEARRLDILVNCAAMVGTAHVPGWATRFEDQRLDAWQGALDINLTAPFLLVQACRPLLDKSPHASVVNVASIYGLVGPDWRLYEGTPLGNPAAYAVSKGGLLQLTRWLATALAPAIRVNAITPGGVYRQSPEPFLSRYVTRTPLRRMATEEDLKGAIVYLASDLSAYVTGHNLVVDGGWTAW
jgi:NAD(P)-dependent dehydrogenase (short-subunit alcohol dehydrogenase family)